MKWVFLVFIFILVGGLVGRFAIPTPESCNIHKCRASERQRWESEQADWDRERQSRLKEQREWDLKREEQQQAEHDAAAELDRLQDTIASLRSTLAEEQRARARAREEWRQDEERHRAQEGPEERARWLSALWNKPQGARCLAYNTREYTTEINGSEVCNDAPLDLYGTITMAHSCSVVCTRMLIRTLIR